MKIEKEIERLNKKVDNYPKAVVDLLFSLEKMAGKRDKSKRYKILATLFSITIFLIGFLLGCLIF